MKLNQLLIYVLLVVSGCDIQGMNNEFTNKTEYSILQVCEYKYREVENDEPYMVLKNAAKSDKTVLAFPIRGKATGYVVMLAQAEGIPKDKAMPEADLDFVVTKRVFAEIKATTPLSQEIVQFIEAHIVLLCHIRMRHKILKY